eukprot:m.286421 g.286421  ORF g.286421 m.286421 type:complete len:52 (-) comp19930_c0_seq1:2242-2397(-)
MPPVHFRSAEECSAAFDRTVSSGRFAAVTHLWAWDKTHVDPKRIHGASAES